MRKTFSIPLIPALVAFAFSGSAAAAGFQLQNQTGSGNGNAYAGAAASAEDAGTIMWNPAGMTYLPSGHSISVAGTLLYREIDFNNKGSTTVSAAAFPLGTTDGGNAGGLKLIPAGYWAYAVSPSLYIGIGVSPTFGNTTEYNFSFVGRDAGYFTEAKQININPSVAYKLNDNVSLGAGLDIAHNSVHFKQGLAFTLGALPALNAAATKNHADIEGDDWAAGFNLGAMFQVSPSTRIGLAYRSQMTFHLEGEQKTSVTGFGSPLLANQDIKATWKTPANFSFALSHKATERLELLGDVTWTDWSIFDQLKLRNRGGTATLPSGTLLNVLSYNFRDTWRVGLGANYQYDSNWKLRFGMAFDKTPVKSPADRTMTLPDSNRTWLAFGAKYQISPKSSFDIGYAHIFFESESTARAVQFPAGTTRQVIRGDWNNRAEILSLQYNHGF